MSVAVRFPVGAEIQACRMLLPEIAGDPTWSDFRIATVGSPPQVIGAVATTPVVDRDGTVAARLVMRVARPFRRRGFGRSIVEAIVAEARDRVPRLLVRSEPTVAPEARPFLTACGFRLDERHVFHRAGYAVARERLLALSHRLQDRGAIPPSARILPLGEVPIDRLVELHVALIGGMPAGIAAMLRARTAPGVEDNSHVLVLDGRPEGLFLFETRHGVTSVASLLVSPPLQAIGGTGGWPSLMLMAEGFRRNDRRFGPGTVHTLRFDCRESNHRMMGLARRLGATVERTAEIFGRATR